jgi:hypothetical protein
VFELGQALSQSVDAAELLFSEGRPNGRRTDAEEALTKNTMISVVAGVEPRPSS